MFYFLNKLTFILCQALDRSVKNGVMLSKYTIKIERTRNECIKGICGHPHEIPFTFKQKQIVCSDLSCKEDDISLIKHIFVPYDGSRFSNHAFEFALDLARKYNSLITVGTVMDSSLNSSFLDIQESNKKIIDKEKLALMEKTFEKMRQLSKKFMISIKTEVFASSSITDSLVTFSNSNKVDLIVMGTRGKGDNRLMMLGSVSIGVSQKASAPVLLIK